MKSGDREVHVGTAVLGCPPGAARWFVHLCTLPGFRGQECPRHTGKGHPKKALQALLLCIAVFLLSGAGDPATRFTELGHQLMCICGACGDTILSCNHIGCAYSDSMRNELMAQVTRGDSDSLVQQAFVQKYGPTVLAAPTTTGFNRTAWIVPFVMLFLGISIAVLVVRAWKNRPAPATADGLRPVRGAELEQFRDQASKETEL
jgi:cytochrome c-type biogenesis protein CcmH